MKKSLINIPLFDVVQSILSAKDDERIRGLVLNFKVNFEGGGSSNH